MDCLLETSMVCPIYLKPITPPPPDYRVCGPGNIKIREEAQKGFSQKQHQINYRN